MSQERATVLFVDDEERILRSLRMLFRGRYEVLTTTSGHEALKMVRERRVHVVVSDQRMPLMLGVDLLRQVREISPVTMRLLLTGYSDLQAIVASVNESEIFRFIEKPWQAPYLLDVVEQAVRIATQEMAGADTVAQIAAKITVAAEVRTAAAAIPSPQSADKVLVIDEEAATFRLVRELLPEQHDVQYATSVEAALAVLAEQDIAVVVAELGSSRNDDLIGTLKTLKRYSPATLTIAVNGLAGSTGLIELINQGQIYRFLPKPLSRELLRRSLISALERYRQMQAAPILARRHAVEEPQFAPSSLSAKLMTYWRRIRDNGRARQGA
jgi:DNA-binding NtrC family response regulator